MKLLSKKTLSVIFPLILALTLVVGIFTYNNNKVFNDTSFWLKHSYTVLDKSDDIYALVKDVETNSNNYLFTGDTNSLISYKAATKDVSTSIDTLKHLCADNLNLQVRIDSLTHFVNAQIRFIDNYMRLTDGTSTNKNEQRIYVNRSRYYSDKINALLGEILLSENNLLQLREAANSKSIAQFHTVFYSLLICLFTLIISLIALLLYLFKHQERVESAILKALEREKELNEMKSRFVSFASHEFRTPLATIMSSVQILEQYKGEKLETMAPKHLSRVTMNVKNMIDLLNDFLSIGKLEEGKTVLTTAETDVVKIANNVIDNLNGMLKEGQKVLLETSGNPENIETDGRLLQNVLNNLLSNAIKYSPAGSLIIVGLSFNDNNFILTVKDNGIGIPEEDQKFLFERFHRASNATHVPGTGLGLNIVKRYIDLLKGSISISSKPNSGTTFEVQLPKVYS